MMLSLSPNARGRAGAGEIRTIRLELDTRGDFDVLCQPGLFLDGIRQVDYDLAQLNLMLERIETRALDFLLPRRQAAVKDIVHLLKSLALGLPRRQEEMDKSHGVEAAKDHVHLPVDVRQ